MFADYHVHTEFSDDSIYPMEDAIRDAVRMNMEEICITDHTLCGKAAVLHDTEVNL